MGEREFLHHLQNADTEPKWSPLNILLRIVKDTPLENLSWNGLLEAASDIYNKNWGAKVDEAKLREDLETVAVNMETRGEEEKARKLRLLILPKSFKEKGRGAKP